MKSVRITMLVVGAALLLVLSAMTVAAAPNSAGALDNPGLATYIDGASHTIAGNSAQWYKFDYSANRNEDGTRDVATVMTNYVGQSGLGFEVYTPDQIASWWSNDPIGRGSSQSIPCGQIDDDWNYTCQAYSLLWAGRFPSSGTYYVRVTNDSPNSIDFTLTEQD
jgi:hypothetical protein